MDDFREKKKISILTINDTFKIQNAFLINSRISKLFSFKN
ncbi:hypothetical protein BOVA514_531 [Bacteroides ovatus]|nr:hypothetical protein BOVA514_531 [Bacteroides ovatus]CAG9903677.1 hypothetical protein BOVA713_4944 [Bacteroides ovatus]